jgi:hypothetical protein
MSRTKAPEAHPVTSALLAGKVVSRPVTLALPPLHTRQYHLVTAIDEIPGVRFVIGACGTKFGKTFGCCIAIVKRAWDHPNTLNWWIAPTFAQSKNAFNLCKKLLPAGTFMPYQADMRIVLLTPDGNEHSVIEFKSGDNSDSLRGFGVHYFICDEAARMPYESFLSIITTVTQTFAPGIFISTPHARNWFYDIYQRGEKFFDDGTPKFSESDPDPFPQYLSIRMATWSNPTVPLESIRQMKRSLPEDVFRQEVAAQFLLDSAGVFRGVSDCIRGELQEPLADHSYIMGVDLGRLKDFTVLTVMDRNNRHVVYQERFNKISWEVQYHRIIETAKRYRSQVYMDSTGIGDPVVQTVQGGGINVVPYSISSNTAKHQLIDKLRLNIENQKISFPADLVIMRRELASYEYNISTSGVVRFSAPSGQHDDTVISLALANWGADVAPFIYKHSNRSGV